MVRPISLQALQQGGALQRQKIQTLDSSRRAREEKSKSKEFNIANAIIDGTSAYFMAGGPGGGPVALSAAATAAFSSPRGEFDPAGSVTQGATLGLGAGSIQTAGGGDFLKGVTDLKNIKNTAATIQAIDPKKAGSALKSLTTGPTKNQSQNVKSKYIQTIGLNKETDKKSLQTISEKIQTDTALSGSDKSELQKYVNQYSKDAKEEKKNVFGETQNRIDQLTEQVTKDSDRLNGMLAVENTSVQERESAVEKFRTHYSDQLKKFKQIIRTNPNLKSNDLLLLEANIDRIQELLDQEREIPEPSKIEKGWGKIKKAFRTDRIQVAK